MENLLPDKIDLQALAIPTLLPRLVIGKNAKTRLKWPSL
jgi:hypothetical protein